MNIHVQCCAAAILLLLLYFFLSQQPLGLKNEKIFIHVISVSLACIFLDIISIVAIVNRAYIPELLLEFICKTYIVSLTGVGFSGLVYATMDTQTRSRQKKGIRRLFLLVFISAVAIYLLPIYYYHDGYEVYTYGPACNMTYAVALFFVCTTFYMIVAHGQEMNPKRRRAVALWMGIWIIAAVIQFFHAKILLVGFAMAFGIMILFFELENPEANIDRETGAYNAHALLEYLKQYFEQQKKFALLLVNLEEYKGNEERGAQIDAAIKEVVKYIGKHKDIKIFKNVERELILIMEDDIRMEEILSELDERCRYAWNDMQDSDMAIVIKPCYVAFQDSAILSGTEEILRLMKYYKVEKYIHSDSRIIYIDEEKVAHVRERDKTEQMILEALEEDRVEAFYQPIYSVHNRRFTSAEALARIRERDGSIVPPNRFIPVAEETGLILRLGEVIFEKTCRFIKVNNLRERGVDYIEVNLSVKQCEEEGFADSYMQIIRKYDIDPGCINLEITETASIQTKHMMVDNMERMITHGVHFSLDDFGNGESNLNYIVDMPVSIVKFDRDMCQAYFENKRAKFVMEAAMNMIHEMELKIVSEGIETEEQMKTIVGLGIDYIQGYYFSKPLSETQYLQFIDERNRA